MGEYTVEELAACAEREVRMRQGFYRRQALKQGLPDMSPDHKRELAMMEEIARRLRAEVRANEGDLFEEVGK
jgi:aspartate/glutamate racemase